MFSSLARSSSFAPYPQGLGVGAAVRSAGPGMGDPQTRATPFRLMPLFPVLALLVGMLAGQMYAPADAVVSGSSRSVVEAGFGYVGGAVLPAGASYSRVLVEPKHAKPGRGPAYTGASDAGGPQSAVASSLYRPSLPDDVHLPVVPLYRLYRVLLI